MSNITTDAPDPNEIVDITVIGAGPVGLSAAFWAGMREASVRIIDSLPELGGQLTALYPEKWIFDVPGHPKVLAKDLVEQLREQALEQFNVPVHLETTAEQITWEEDADGKIVVLHTDKGEIRSRALVIAGGHGAFEPKKLPGFDMDPWEGRGAHYMVGEKKVFEGKKVLIVGGGDSAFDWVLNLLDTADEVTLVHRREGYRAHESTIAEVMAHAEAGRVKMRIPYEISHIEGEDGVEKVHLSVVGDGPGETLIEEADAVLLQLGFKTALGPLKDWGFEVQKGAIVVDPLMHTSLDHVWACGDISTFDGKLKLIATGFAESAVAIAQAVHTIRPDTKIQPKYSTNTGVPGAVEGQA